MKRIHVVAVVAAAVVSGGVAQAQRGALIAHDPFDYPVGALGGGSGGVGFSDAWSSSGEPNLISEPGLTFPGVDTVGRKVKTTGTNIGSFRDLGATYGNDGQTYWVSFIGAVDPDNQQDLHFEAYSGLSFFEGNDERLFMGLPWQGGAWGFDRTGTGTFPGTTAADTTPRLLVFRFDFADPDVVISMYVDPDPTVEPTTADILAIVPGFLFNRIRIQAGTHPMNINYDEFRFGYTYSDVTTADTSSILAYEGFDYPAGQLSENNGGSGWGGAWSASQVPILVTPPGMSFGSLEVSGNKTKTPGFGRTTFRSLEATYGGTETLWVSLLAGVDPGNTAAIPQDAWGGVSLFEGNDERLYMGTPYGDGRWGFARSGCCAFSTDTAIDLTMRFLVYRLEYAGPDVMVSMWVDPLPGGGPGPQDPPDVQETVASFVFNRVRIGSGNQALSLNFDEVRIGLDYGTVAPGGCRADYDGDGFVTGLDFDAFVADFEAGDPASDFDGDGFVTGLDFDAYVVAFEAGC